MALNGRLEDFKLPDIFKLISSGKKSGTLYLDEGTRQGAVLFNKGKVVFAYTGENDIGQKLVNCKLISESTLKYVESYLKEKDHSEEGFAEILIKQNFITKKKLTNFLETQAKDVLSDMLSWIEGEFNFEIDSMEIQNQIIADLDVAIEEVMEEARQKLSTWKKIQKVIPDSQAVIHLSPKGAEGKEEVVFSPSEWKIVSEVNGIRTVSEVASICNIDKFTVCKLLVRLAKDEYVTVATHKIAEQVLEDEKTQIEEAKNVVLLDDHKEAKIKASIEDIAEQVDEEIDGGEIESIIEEKLEQKTDLDEKYEEPEVIDEETEAEKINKITKNFKATKDIASISLALEELSMLNKERTDAEKAQKAKDSNEKVRENARKTSKEKPKSKTSSESKKTDKVTKEDQSSKTLINKFFGNLKNK